MNTMDIHEILKHLPHRYPFLLVDRVVDFEPGKFLHAYKNITINEPFFVGHFPHHPVLPGVLIMEALAQAGGVLTQLSLGRDAQSKLFYMVKVDNARFSRQVVPGDVLELHVQIKRVIRNMAVYYGEAKVDGQLAACAEVLCAGTRE